jgi:hypothetical protein
VGLSQTHICWLHDPDNSVGQVPGTYGINDHGNIRASGRFTEPEDPDADFEAGDVIGCGVRVKQENPAKAEVFFTWNGQLFGGSSD